MLLFQLGRQKSLGEHILLVQNCILIIIKYTWIQNNFTEVSVISDLHYHTGILVHICHLMLTV